MRIVDERGAVLAPTYWTTRRNNHTDLASLLIANTITGAAAMMRRRLLDVVLPFPDGFGAAFHDHWLACAALATGAVRYLPRPLYDYVQHGRNVIGHVAPPALPAWVRIFRWIKFCWPPNLPINLKRALGNGRTHYFDNLLRVRQLAETVRLRCGAGLPPGKRRALRRVAGMHAGPTGWLWLLLRPFRHPSGVSDTVGMEHHLLNALLWTGYARASRLRAGRRAGSAAGAAPGAAPAGARAA
jgi:hypothetical protein